MLRKIWNAIKAIGAFFSAIVDFVQNIIKSIVEFFSMIPKAIKYVMDSFSWLPVSFIAIVSVVIVVLVIKKVVNR